MLHAPTEIFTRIDQGYDTILTASAMNPMPGQEGNFLPEDLCRALHEAVDILAVVRDRTKAILEEGG